MIVTGKKFAENREKIVAALTQLEERVIARHDSQAADKIIDSYFEIHLNRDQLPEFFEECIDPIIPDDFDFLAKFPVVEDQTFQGRSFKKMGIEFVTFAWWNANVVTVKIKYVAGYLQKRLDTHSQARWSAAADGPSFEQIVETVEQFGTPAWAPQIKERVRGKGKPAGSRFCGNPWLPDAVAWPTDADGDKMAFVAQFNLAEFPEPVREIVGNQGLISVFCNPFPGRAASGSDKSSHEARLFRFTLDEPGSVRASEGDARHAAKPSHIVGWTRGLDFPTVEDLTKGFLDMPEDIRETICQLPARAFGTTTYTPIGKVTKAQGVEDASNVRQVVRYRWGRTSLPRRLQMRALSLINASGNKLCGWPSWGATPDWKIHEGRRMMPLFQFDAVYGLGLGYPVSLSCNLFVAPENPEIMKITTWRNG